MKKDTRFKKGLTPWNKGLKGWTFDDPEHRATAERNLADGRKNCWKTRDRSRAYNSVPTCVYDLDGNFVAVYSSIKKAALSIGAAPRNACRLLKKGYGSVAGHQLRKAEVVVFMGRELVKKTPIAPYKKRSRKK